MNRLVHATGFSLRRSFDFVGTARVAVLFFDRCIGVPYPDAPNHQE